jgi:HEAT repeat protein
MLIQNLKYRDKSQYRGPAMAAVYSVGAFAPGEGETVPKLIPVLKGLDAQGRAAAAYDLGTLRKEEASAAKIAVPDLIELLDDNVPEVRLCAVEAIANIDSEQASMCIPALIELLKDTSWKIRIRAVEELRKLGPRANTAIPALKERLMDEAPVVRVWSDEAIKTIEQRK